MADVILYYLISSTVVAIYLISERGSSFFGAVFMGIFYPLFLGLLGVYIAFGVCMVLTSYICEQFTTNKGDRK